ncbi:MAG: hypothetical protein JWM75_486 [Sphingomonas bacterium]|nr:hypothetical protein [Sphingomonas bacterium]
MAGLGSYRVLVPVHLVAAPRVAALGFTLSAAPIALAVLIGLTLPGGTSGVQGLIAQLYLTAVRATRWAGRWRSVASSG